MAMQVGNVDCVVLPGLLLAWVLLDRGFDTRAALIVGVPSSLKLTPVILVWWLVVTGRRRAAAVAIACGATLALVAMLGSEPLIFARLYEVTAANPTAPASDLGPPGQARALGMLALIVVWLPRAVLLGGVALTWATRRRPGISWSIGAILMWLLRPLSPCTRLPLRSWRSRLSPGRWPGTPPVRGLARPRQTWSRRVRAWISVGRSGARPQRGVIAGPSPSYRGEAVSVRGGD
jgi:hypothetical protein